MLHSDQKSTYIMIHKINKESIIRKLEKYIGNRYNPVGRYTINILAFSPKIKLLGFSEVDKNARIMYSLLKPNIKTQAKRLTLKRMKCAIYKYDGFISFPKIYINEKISEEQLLNTVVHEVNHFVNLMDDRSKSERCATFEYMAFLAEYMFENFTTDVTESYSQKLKKDVEKYYSQLKNYSAFDLQSIPIIPDGIYY